MKEGLFELDNAGSFDEINAEVQRALDLLDGKSADEIIGEQTEEYEALIKGSKSMMTLLWIMLQKLGLKQKEKSQHRMAQAMTVILTLVHYAYALGIERGKGRD